MLQMFRFTHYLKDLYSSMISVINCTRMKQITSSCKVHTINVQNMNHVLGGTITLKRSHHQVKP